MHQLICRGASGYIDGISNVLAPLLIARGADTFDKAQAFLHPDISQLHDPMTMRQMEDALAILHAAIARKAPIVVYGDYDCDGVCACAILLEAFRMLDAPARAYIPSRHDEGYGLNEDAIRRLCAPDGVLITVDCGITGVNEVRLAQEMGMQVIVTDHHTAQEDVPTADALLHPNDGAYENNVLCGAGVAFKLASALLGRVATELLDLAALATIADMVPLLGENRAIAALGVQRMPLSPRPGLQALMQISGIQPGTPVSGMQCAFQLAPRINACGRMDTADIALELLTTRSPARAQALAEQADRLNAQRKNTEQRILDEALEQVQQMDLCTNRAIIVQGEGWQSGVVGLVAGRIAEKYGYPTVALSQENGVCVGSARSASGVDLYQALHDCADLFVRFGGHKQAAGLTIESENVPAFRKLLSDAVQRQLGDRIPMPQTAYDAELLLSDVTVPFIEELSQLEPCGMGNPAPVYLLHDADVLAARAVGADGAHLKLTLAQGDAVRDGIAFQMGSRAGVLSGKCDLAVTPVINEFRGRQSAECRVEAIGRSSARFTEVPDEESHALLQDFAQFCRIDISYTPCESLADVQDIPLQGTLLLCRTADTANRMAERYPLLDCLRGKGHDARAYSAVWLCSQLCDRGPYRRVILCDGLTSPQEAAALRALYPQAEICALPQTNALRERWQQLTFSVDDLRTLYRDLRANLRISLDSPRTAAMATVLADMQLITLAPALQLLPMVKSNPLDNPLYQLIHGRKEL